VTTTTNGASPELEHHVKGLRELADAVEAEALALEHALSGKRAEAARLRRALDALTGQPRVSKAHGDKEGWVVSDKKVAQIWEAIRRHDDEWTPTQIRQETGTSAEAVRRSVTRLREAEYIRAVGVTKGGGRRYRVMPGAAERDWHGA